MSSCAAHEGLAHAAQWLALALAQQRPRHWLRQGRHSIKQRRQVRLTGQENQGTTGAGAPRLRDVLGHVIDPSAID